MDLDGLLFIDAGKWSDSRDGNGLKSFLKPLAAFVVVRRLFFWGSPPPSDLLPSPPLKALNNSQRRKATYFET
jgi:hypothetical protein